MKIQLFSTLFVLFILSGIVSGQVQPDTLTLAKSLNDQGKLKKSMALLSAYHKFHPGDLYANWIYAQTSYQKRRYKLSASLYEQALALSPENSGLRLDYAKSLVNTGEFAKADEQLKIYTSGEINNPEPWFYMARIHYWKGEHVKALEILDNLLLHMPDYLPARKLREEIMQDRAPWLSLNTTYSWDDQPLKMLIPTLKGGWYRSNLLGLDFQLTVPVSIHDDGKFNAFGFSAGNTFHFSKPKLGLYLNLGLFNHTSLNSLGWTGEFKIEKDLFKKMSVWVDVQRKPYLSTLSSFKLPLFENHLVIATSLDDPDHWNGQLSIEGSTFSSDNNWVAAFCGWIFAPTIKTGRFNFHFGYGYNYSTAKESRFTSEKSLGDIISGWESDALVTGIYNPYFTPKDQQIHSLLAVINFSAAKKLGFSVNFNGGFYATTQYPFVYLDKDVSDSIFVNQGFARKTYFPFNVNAGMNWNISKTIDLLARFTYNSTIYYNTKTVGITIRKRF